MLHKRFKSAKCKTALKLATSRIKLMKNKKGVQINQMKRDLAQLLETGQDRTARIRVEHVIREEKMVAAYDLIEIYCELIVARLPIIESQKTCPIDLKEAVTSVIFAAPRCSDISELADVRKQFTAKYGKDFVSAAIELHPDCGVSRMLVEKLSAVAPDLQTKIKVLTAVAKDHNIDWDPTSFEEKDSKPPSDLLNGPASFENASVANVEPPKIQPVVHSHEEKQQTVPVDFSEQNRKYTVNTQNVTSKDSDGQTSSSVTHEWLDMKQNWNMEFKDATSAAQAAAESAERAAVAARAAARFSSQGKGASHQPTGSHVSDLRDEPPHVSASAGSSGQSFLDDDSAARGAAQVLSQEKIANRQPTGPHVPNSRDKPPHVSAPSGSSGQSLVDQSQHYTSHKATDRLDRSNNDIIEDEKSVNNFHMTDGYFEESFHEDLEGPSFSDQKSSNENENINFFASEKQSTHSSASGDELDVSKKPVVGNPFAVVDKESPFTEAANSSPHDDVISDDNNDDDDDDDDVSAPRFDTGFEYDETEASHSLENTHIWSPRTNRINQPISQSHIFSESISFGAQSTKSMEPSETDNQGPASFDHSDVPDSGSESELLDMNPKPSSVVESSQTSNARKSRIELNDLLEVGTSFEDEETQMQSQHELKKRNFDQESSDASDDNSDSLNQRLNFGTLTGGLRNKGGLRYPPYPKSATVEKSTEEDKKPKISKPVSDSDSELKASKQANTKPIFSPPAAFFDDDDRTDFDDEVPKPVPSKVRLGSGLSRRTRGSPSVTHSKTHVEPEPKLKPKPESMLEAVVPAESRTYARRSKVEDDKQISESRPTRKTVETSKTKLTTFEPPQVDRSAPNKQEADKIVPESKNPMREHVSSRIVVEPGKVKDAKTQNLGSEMVSGVKKASHVHPKLPEYDSLAARLQSLRTDRQ